MFRKMGEEPREGDQPLPPEIQEELEQISEPTEAELKKFEHLKKPFTDALKKAAKNKGKDINPESNN